MPTVPMNNVDKLTDMELLTHVIVTSSSIRLIRKAAVTSKDLNEAARRARPSLLKFLARQGRHTAERVIGQIVQLNLGTQRPDRPSFVDDPNDDRYGQILNWDMSNLELEYLPDSLCDLVICGDLDLSKNKLKEIPENFGDMIVGGFLDLSSNFLERIPEGGWKCQVSGDLRLHENDFFHADSIPESFGGIIVGGNLSMCYCRLNVLPQSFGDMTVGGDLDLHGNRLVTVPDSFGLIRVAGDIDLRMNDLHEIPESIGRLIVGKTLRLNANAIVKLPAKFKQMKIGGDLDLRCNHLTDFDPAFFENMWVHGHILLEQQTVFNAAYYATLAAEPDPFWLDPATGNFTWAPPVNETVNDTQLADLLAEMDSYLEDAETMPQPAHLLAEIESYPGDIETVNDPVSAHLLTPNESPEIEDIETVTNDPLPMHLLTPNVFPEDIMHMEQMHVPSSPPDSDDSAE